MEELTTRLGDTGEAVQLKLKEKKRLEGYLVAIDEKGKPLPNQPEEVPSDVSLSDEELEQFQALSASDKLRYNQWYAFHHEYQCQNNITGTATQITSLTKTSRTYPTSLPRMNLLTVRWTRTWYR